MFKEDVYGLTSPQKNIWQLEQVNEDKSSINHIYAVMRLSGRLDEEILEKTINKIIEINDSFRIKIKKENGKIYQYIDKYNWIDIQKIKAKDKDISKIIDECQKNSGISLDNLFTIRLIFTECNTYVSYNSHHIIADAWGMTQVAEQIKEIYATLVKNEEYNKKKNSYLTLIEREKKYKNSDKYEKDKKFWEEYVKNINNTKLFKVDDRFQKKAKRYEYILDEGLFDKISEYCKQNKITEYAFFLGTVATYFKKIFNSNEMVIGTPFLNRQKRSNELEATGMYISTLPLYVNVEKCNTFVELCQNITTSNLSLYKHSNFPYHKIQELYCENTHDNTNLYDVGFSYQVNTLQNHIEGNDFGECKWYFSGEQNNPITIHLTTLNHYKILNYDYLISYFKDEEIEKMNQIIITLIKQILKGKNNFKDINTLTENDIKKLNILNNSGNLENKETVVKVIDGIINEFKEKQAIICGEENITYCEFGKKINQLANKLIRMGINKNSPIALFFDKSIEMIIAMFGVLKAGGCYVPILPDEDRKRIEYILKDSNPKFIITHKNYKIKTDIQIINIENIDEESTENPDVKVKNEDIAYIIYTSGSTGNPKGTMVTHKNICNLKESIKNDEILKATCNDISLSILKYSFDASGIDIYTALLFGGTLVLVQKEEELNPKKVIKIMEKHKVTRSFSIPKWIENIAVQDKLLNVDLSNLKILGTGGETLKPYILNHLLDKYEGLKVLNLYGPTETTMFTTCKVVTKKEIEENYTSIGRPIYGARIGVVNSENEFMPLNTKGELIIYEDEKSIKNISKGYLNLEEISNKKFIEINNPITGKKIKIYKTGDIVKINNNLEIEFMGRDDDVVKVNGGYLIALSEVENTIQKLLGENFKAYPIAIPYNNTKIIILFLTKKEKNISLENIKRFINKNISFYMKPKKIIEIKEFPRNSSGKIDRKELKRIAIKYMEENKKEIILPKTKLEKEIYNDIKKIITIDEFSICDDFMDDLGIDSLSLTALYTYLEKYNIKIQDIYNNSNIKDLANFIENNNVELNPDLTDIEKIKIKNNIKIFDLSNVLITGVTGFLGMHLLKELLNNDKTKKIYCIIRNKINFDGKKRLVSLVEYYFPKNEDLLNLINKKVIILDGDITKEKLGLEQQQYNYLKKEITTVINSAANVRHFAKPQVIRKDNVQSVKQIIEFCENKISFAHISTLSIAGFKGKNTKNEIYDENTLYINQEFKDNPYLISKFEAEKEIIKVVQNENLNAIIFRLGNIMPRIEDGKFQKNEKQNVFLQALKTIINSKIIAKELLELELEFSPVDECSKIIIELMKNNKENLIYHILNNKGIKISELIQIFKEYGHDVKIGNMNEFINELEKIADEYTKQYILNNNLNKYSQDITLKEMKKRNINWAETDKKYIEKILKIIQKF